MSKKSRRREGRQAPAQPAAARPFSHAWILAGLALAAVFIYAVSLNGPFVFDDLSYITGNPLIRDFSAFFGRAAGSVNENVDIHFRNRAAAFFTFALNYAAGGPDPAGFRAVNIGIHVANAWLVYWAALLLLGRVPPGKGGEPPAEGQARAGAAAAALLFAAHPLQTQAVAYIAQRFTSLAAFFCLLSFCCYLSARLRPGRGGWFYAGSLAAAALAMKAKENAFTLPVMIVAAELLFFRAAPGERLRRLAPLLLTMLIIPAGLMFGGPERRSAGQALTAAGGEKPEIASYALSQPEALASYLRLLAWPAGQNADYDPPLRKAAEPPVIWALLLLTGLAGLGGKLALSGHRLKAVAGFGVAWFFVMNAVESSFIPLGDLRFEHRAYLPSFGIFLAAGSLAAAAWASRFRGAALAVFLCAAAALAWTARARAAVWGSEEALWRDAALKSPLKARPHYNLGSLLVRQERFAEGAAELELALAAQPDHPDSADVWYNLGLARAKMLDYPGAEAAFRAAQRLAPGRDSPYFNLGVVYLRQGRVAEARREFEAALRANPAHAKARARLAGLR